MSLLSLQPFNNFVFRLQSYKIKKKPLPAFSGWAYFPPFPSGTLAQIKRSHCGEGGEETRRGGEHHVGKGPEQ